MGGRCERGKRNETDGRDGISVKDGARAIDGCDVFVVCGGFAHGGLVAVCLEENVFIFAYVCVTELEFFKATNFIRDVIEDMKFEDV